MVEKIRQAIDIARAAAPALIFTIHLVEGIFGPKSGAEKKQAVVEMVMGQLRPVLPDFLEGMVQSVLGAAIDVAVQRFNAIGWEASALPAGEAA
ncbi:MAG TPA: hypothetical protein VD930_09755 [Gemmatimonadales bacterium]|nr:hypothetical protein [Gemmatimonadales bacterium]